MDDREFKDLVLDGLKGLDSKLEHKYDKLHEKIHELVIQGVIQSKDIAQIKEDLFEHKEGVKQNRARIELLEKVDGSQAAEIQNKINELKLEFNPVIEYVKRKQEFPKKLMQHSLYFTKLIAALSAITAVGAGIGKFIAWAATHIKF